MLKKLLIFSLFYSISSFGQSDACFSIGRFQSIKTEHEEKKGEIYLLTKSVDSTGNIVLFLMNRSESDAVFYGNRCGFFFKTEAKDRNNVWRNIDKKYLEWCGTGDEYFGLPPNAYTWQKINRSHKSGDFKTEVRYNLVVNDSIIYSDPIEILVDNNVFLNPYNVTIDHLEKAIKEGNENDIKKYSLQKVLIYRLLNYYDNMLDLSKKLLKKYPNDSEVKYIYVHSVLASYQENVEKISTSAEIGIFSEIINEIEKIPIGTKRYESAVRILEGTIPCLVTEAYWKEFNDLECDIIDGRYNCFVESIIGKKVTIRFK